LSFVKNCVRFFERIAANGSGIAKGGEKEAQKFVSAPQLAKPFFCLLINIFQSK